MAGIYIPGMEMPKDGYKVVYIHSNGGVYEPSNSEHVWSKLATAIPVPDHGDLIDRNKLDKKTAEWEAQALHMVEVTMHDEDATEWRKWSTVLTERSAFKFDVADAPIIITADGDHT